MGASRGLSTVERDPAAAVVPAKFQCANELIYNAFHVVEFQYKARTHKHSAYSD